jgi:hypothetical protein
VAIVAGKAGEELVHGGFPQGSRMPLAMKKNVLADPRDVGPLGAASQVQRAGRHANAIEELRAARSVDGIPRIDRRRSTDGGVILNSGGV